MVTLGAGASELAVAPAIGGAIAWYRTAAGARAIDWMRPATSAAIAAGDSGAMSCFPLVPFSNRIRDGRFRFAGRTVRLPLNVPGQRHTEHGHGWQARWQVVSHAENTLSLEYRHAADAWPFPYMARQVFRLDENRLTVEIEARNLGDAPMPIGLGLHPYFPRAAATRLMAGVARMWDTDGEVMPTALIDPPADRRLERGVRVDAAAMDNAFTGWSRRATIEWPESQARLTMTAEGPLSFLVVYTPPGEAYFCAEPVSHCTDAFNLADQGRDDTGMIVLRPHESVTAAVHFETEFEQVQ